MGIDEPLLERLTAEAIAKLKKLVENFKLGAITWTKFKARVVMILRGLYTEAMSAIQGAATLSAEEKRVLQEAINDQLYPGGGYSLEEVLEEYNSGAISVLMLTARLVLYLKSARLVVYKVARERDRLNEFYIRMLGATDQHCEECLAYTAMPPMRLSDIILPGQDCRCRSNCLCRLVKVPNRSFGWLS